MARPLPVRQVAEREGVPSTRWKRTVASEIRWRPGASSSDALRICTQSRCCVWCSASCIRTFSLTIWIVFETASKHSSKALCSAVSHRAL